MDPATSQMDLATMGQGPFYGRIKVQKARVWKKKEKDLHPTVRKSSFDRWDGANLMLCAKISLWTRTPLIHINGNLIAQRTRKAEIDNPFRLHQFIENTKVDDSNFLHGVNTMLSKALW
ncbi:hypothetical protein CAPTEDRAFT_185130 [Capitella teleta]|uniref:Uncharacterized protein n=1 Tax=Capitella teleta TaxID=283909 RepID=R7UEH5_CAPTE|nr:hypothetical protein CAPTEDRAFT_185130 [Capitella teleta]|eukprot:ELU02193.1 hypothetical protein CAPTEDRAFT_185130 [Capitella teleta]